MEYQNGSTSVEQMQIFLLESIQTALAFHNEQTKDDDNSIDAQKLSSSLINTESQVLTDCEKTLVTNLCNVVHFSRRKNPMDFNRKHDFAHSNQSKDKLKVLLANFLAAPVKRVVTFAQNVPDFAQLEVEDRINLLKETTIGISISASSSLYNSVSNVYQNLISRDKNIYADRSKLDLSVMKGIWSEELHSRTTNFLKSLNELCFDEACLALFLSIILFSNETINLRDPERVRSIRVKYSCLLRKYMLWKMGDKAEKAYCKLLSKLPELKCLGQMHVGFFQDVDPKQLDKFLLAFVFGKKNKKLNQVADEAPTECMKYEL
uniref:Nuclear receptor n=1 Tax=Brachionus plicatilis TaxID=10195 RepID=A0A221CB30_BRAPC|nr:nuclear receptor [Brachionus plicatilis]